MAEDPQQRYHTEWANQSNKRRAEWEDKRARRRAEFAARIPAIAAQVASEVSAAVAAALRVARAGHHEDLDLAPTTTTASVISERATSIQMLAAAPSIPTSAGAASASHDSDFALVAPTTCSTECPGRGNGATRATAAPSASATSVVPSVCGVHKGGVHLAASCLQPRDMLACALPPSTATLTTLPVPLSIALAEHTVAMTSPSADITLDPRAPISATTKPAASAALGSDLIMAPPTIRFAVCHEPVPDAPVVVLTQAMLDITDSSGSGAWVSMSAPLHKPEGADTAVTHEDEQQLACSTVERPLAFVVARDEAGDLSFVTCTAAMPLTLAALAVDGDRIANKQDVLLPLKLLDLSLSESKEPNVTSLLPQVTQAIVTWDTSVNQHQAKCSGMCSGFGCTSSHSFSLLPWDLGEKIGVWRASVYSRDIACGACVEQLDADLSGSHDHHQKSRYANTQTNFHWPAQVFCSSENVIGECCCQDISMELLQYQFDCADTISKLYVERIIACAHAYPAVCAAQVPFDDFLLGSFCAVSSNFHPLYLEASAYLSLAASSVHYHCAHVTAALILPSELSSLFDILSAIWSSCEFWSCIFWSQTAASFRLACRNTTLKGLMEQWDPGIAQFFHICSQHCLVSYHLISTAVTTVRAYNTVLQHGFQFSTMNHALLVGGNESKYYVLTQWQVVWPLYFLQTVGSVMDRTSPSQLDCLLQSCDAGHVCFGVSASFSCEVLAIGDRKLMANTGGILMDLHSRLGLVLLGVLVVWTHLTLVRITQWHYRGLNSWDYPMPSASQVMLKRYKPFPAWNTFGLGLLHTTLLQYWLHSGFTGHNIQCPFELIPSPSWEIFFLVPIVARTASNHSHGIVMLGSVIGEGASIFPYCGRLHEKQLCWLPWQYTSYKESLSESFPWYIAWLQVSSCAGSDFDASGTLTSMRKYFGYWEELLPFAFFFCSIAFEPPKGALFIQPTAADCSSLVSYCLTGDHIQWDSELFQWKVPWLYPLLGSWFQCLPTGNGFLYGFGSEQFQREIVLSIDLDYLVVDNKLRLAMPWDPGLGRNVTT